MKLDLSVFAGSSIFSDYWAGWLLLGFLAGLLLVGVFGRGPFRLLGPVARIIGYPFRPVIFLLRRIRLLPRVSARARAARNALASAGAAIPNELHTRSEIDIALSTPGPTTRNETDNDSPAEYKFTEERKQLKHNGLYFRSFSVRPDFFPKRLTAALTPEIGDDYLCEAQTFFNRQVMLKSNYHALFEDTEGAMIITLFVKYDRRCFWALNEMRKTINDNARRLMILFSFILIVDLAILLSPVFNDNIKVLSSLLAFGFLLLSHNNGYQQHQKHIIRELRAFLTRYLGRISDRYREVTGNARGVTVGDETDSKKLSDDAQKWHKIMIWLPFRTFFIETFVRNIFYQIDRNSNYYLYISIPVVIGVLGVLVFAFIYDFFPLSFDITFLGALPLASFAFVFFAYLWLTTKVVIGDELNQLDWLGYDNLNVSAAMDAVVGKWAEDVGFWKGRLDR